MLRKTRIKLIILLLLFNDETTTSILAIERLLKESVYIDEVINNSLVSNVKGITIPPYSYLVKDSISGEFSVLNEDEFNKRFKEI